jgi:hypothetical protein
MVKQFSVLGSQFVVNTNQTGGDEWRRSNSNFYREGDSECTGERAWGQFSIFGAIEEKGGCGFARIGTDKRL